MSTAKTIVITGGTRGIGLGLVKGFATAGANVVFCGRSAEGFGADGMIMAGRSAYVTPTELTLGQLVPGRDEKMRQLINVIGDRLEDVTPWLVAKILAGGSNGSRADWLTRGKVLWRFATAGLRKRDLLSPQG